MTTAVLAVIPIVAPLVAAACALLAGWRRATAALSVAGPAAILAAGIGLAATVGARPVLGAGHLLRVDTLTAIMLIVIGAVGDAGHLGQHRLPRHRARPSGATTAAGARQYGAPGPGLPGRHGAGRARQQPRRDLGCDRGHHHRDRVPGRPSPHPHSPWKRPGSTSSSARSGSPWPSSARSSSTSSAFTPAPRRPPPSTSTPWPPTRTHLDPVVTRMAAGLLCVGFGAKAGLAPFHTWLADAHSQAPAPVSALMSGVLLAVAFSVLLRSSASSRTCPRRRIPARQASRAWAWRPFSSPRRS